MKPDVCPMPDNPDLEQALLRAGSVFLTPSGPWPPCQGYSLVPILGAVLIWAPVPWELN